MGVHRSFLVLALAFTLALAGCLAGDDAPQGGADDAPGSTPPPATMVSKEEGVRLLEGALRDVSAGEGITRLAMRLKAEATNGSEPQSIDGSLLFDSEKGLAVMQLRATGMEDAESMPFGNPSEPFVTGTVHKTGFFGSASQLVGIYNESATPPKRWMEAGGPADAPGESFDLSELQRFLAAPDAEGVKEVTPTIHEGEPALKVTFRRVEANGATVDAEAVIVTSQPARIAYISGRMSDPSAEEAFEREGTFRLDFAYGANAVHPLERVLERMEVLTFQGDGGGFSPMGGRPSLNFTVQPSRSGVKIPLAKVEARVFEQGMGAPRGDETPVIVLGLEEGQKENAELKVLFEDADGDGFVSAGDVVRLQPKAHESDHGDSHEEDYGFGDAPPGYNLRLFDEETGILLMPAPGLFALVAALGALALAVRRRAA